MTAKSHNLAELGDSGNDGLWEALFISGMPELEALRRQHLELPSPPRCRLCFAPFAGPGGKMLRERAEDPIFENKLNPLMCNRCDYFLAANPGGVTVEASMIFVDIVDSKSLRRLRDPSDYAQSQIAFFSQTAEPIWDCLGYVIERAGDHVVAIYPPGMSGGDHAAKAIGTAMSLFRMERPRAADGEPLRLAVAVYTDEVRVASLDIGNVSDGRVKDIKVLGFATTILAGLAAHRRLRPTGGVIVSDSTFDAAMRTEGAVVPDELKRLEPETLVLFENDEADEPVEVSARVLRSET